jgi:hypothetical protein
MSDTPRIAKRRLSEISFNHEGAHLALVHKEQGGAANGYETLIMKSAANFSDEFVTKIQQVRVTMELDDFLEEFFCLYEDDAGLLAAMMGYKEPAAGEEPAGTWMDDSFYSWWREQLPDGQDPWMVDPTQADYQKYIAARLQGIEILKSLRNSDSLASVISKMNEDQYLTLLRDQERIEKALATKESVIVSKAKTAKVTPAVVAEPVKPKSRIVKQVSDQGHKAKATPVANAKAVQAEPKQPEVIKMAKTDAIVVETTTQMEMVEKAQFDLIEKAFADQKELLEKALKSVSEFQAKEKEAIAKARLQGLVDVVGSEEHAATLYKAVAEVEDEVFAGVVKALAAVAAKVDVDPMFIQKGLDTQSQNIVPSTDSILKQQLAAKYAK